MIEIDGVSKGFPTPLGWYDVLEDVTLSLPARSFTALMGPSGSGKSTLVRMIAGLLPADAGTIHVGGENITAATRRRAAGLRLTDIGVVFQDHTLLTELTAAENVELVLRARGVARRRARTEAREALDMFGLERLADQRPWQLSGGQQQRVGIARAFVGGRCVILADEPTGSLDREATATVFGALRDATDRGVTVLVATHDHAVQQWSDAVVQIDGTVLVVDA